MTNPKLKKRQIQSYIFFALAGDLGLDLSFLELRICHSGCRIYLLDLVGDNGYDIVMDGF